MNKFRVLSLLLALKLADIAYFDDQSSRFLLAALTAGGSAVRHAIDGAIGGRLGR